MDATSSLFINITLRKIMALSVPVVLVFSMYWCFKIFNRWFEMPLSYLVGFVIYWLFWCTLVPMLLLGGAKPLMEMFQPFPSFGELSWKTHALLWWPIVFPLFFVFIPRIMKANINILMASVLLGIVIGTTEETLWRGVYMRLFPDNIWLNLIYPSVMFAIWHIAPQSIVVNRMPGGAFSFVIYALVLGVSYTITVYQTKSIAWCTIAHIVHDTLGLGGFAYAIWFTNGSRFLITR